MLDNKVGKTVKFNQNLMIKYHANLIDHLQVYNIFEEKFTKCEHVGWNDEGENNLPFYDFGTIGGFDFDISKNKTRFYFGDAPLIGFCRNKPTFLLLNTTRQRSKKHECKDFVIVDKLNFEHHYPKPRSMWDLAMFIDTHIYCMQEHIEQLLIDFQHSIEEETGKLAMVIDDNGDNDDLPF